MIFRAPELGKALFAEPGAEVLALSSAPKGRASTRCFGVSVAGASVNWKFEGSQRRSKKSQQSELLKSRLEIGDFIGRGIADGN